MRTLSKDQYEEMLGRSEIIERDRHGIKVLRLPDGNFLKTFWYRHRISSRYIYPEWLRFCLHAGSLKRRGIPTVEVLETLRIPHLRRTAIVYRPLEGRTLRQVAAAGGFDGETARQFGGFVARLHRQGILFHSLHLGNVLLCPDGRFGLIDLASMKVFLWPLFVATRRRNFVHLFRYAQDLEVLKAAGLRNFMDGYAGQAPARMRRTLIRFCERVGTP